MKVSAIVGVKDEIELIKRCIDHLYIIGVDQVVIQDYGSTDGTEKVFAQYDKEVLTVKSFDESQDMDGDSWGLGEAEIAVETGADWVILLDADEFWLPFNGSIKDGLANVSSDVLTVERFNVPLGVSGLLFPDCLTSCNYQQVMLYVEKVENIRAELQNSASRSWINSVPMPKIAIRPSAIKAITPGHHNAVDLNGKLFPTVMADEIVIAHVPFTSFDRFQRKVQNVSQSIKLQPSYYPGGTAWHWKRWVQLEEAGELEMEFQNQMINDDQLQTLRNSGTVLSASEYFKSKSKST